MPLDHLAILVASSFTAGCVAIHALRRLADSVTLVLGVVAYGLATALCSLAAGRNGVSVLHDPIHAWGLVTVAHP
ncbi:hypothetical protein [Methylobacterium oryzae]|uniref:hypothetical protein n=1 Tax=Methylobacterium oryzae TaxID=334852 RepID=UPI001F32793D|nr:hypothetical protein [Methylobacterium oryzae]UIN37327.1 hypothetical protein LXM90_12825 [Methylobacterium oryzae]